MPKACKSVVTSKPNFPSLLGMTSPRFTERPSGVTAQSTYVRYCAPNLLAGARCAKSALISRRPALLSTFPLPEASGISKAGRLRSEEHTSELQSRGHLVCRLLLEKKKALHAAQPS